MRKWNSKALVLAAVAFLARAKWIVPAVTAIAAEAALAASAAASSAALVVVGSRSAH